MHRSWPDLAVTRAVDGGMLAARLQLAAPHARTILVASARNGTPTIRVGEAIVQALARMEEAPRLVDLKDASAMDETGLAHLVAGPGRVVVAGAGLLDDPDTLLAAAVVDAVVVVARRERTLRSDLERVRVQLEQAGSHIAGSVLVD